MAPRPRQKTPKTPPRSRGSSPVEAVQRRPVYQIKAEFFRVLGHPVRVRILELLRDGERTVGDLQLQLQMDSSGTSQHLGALRKQGVLDSRREGTSVYYSVRDPRIFQLLEVARQILNTSLSESQAVLGDLATPG
jgi:DNA-binding transcriptional ArsR family regulator